VRPSLVVHQADRTVFLSSLGEAMAPDHLTRLVRNYVESSEIGKQGACHLFRHTMATLMLEGGADVRFIQQMLGHASLATTQMYTQVSIRQLKQIPAATHPTARMQRGAQKGEAPLVEMDADEEHQREDLLSSLAAEDPDDE